MQWRIDLISEDCRPIAGFVESNQRNAVRAAKAFFHKTGEKGRAVWGNNSCEWTGKRGDKILIVIA